MKRKRSECKHSVCLKSAESAMAVAGSLFCAKHVCQYGHGCVNRQVHGLMCKRHVKEQQYCDVEGCNRYCTQLDASQCPRHSKFTIPKCTQCDNHLADISSKFVFCVLCATSSSLVSEAPRMCAYSRCLPVKLACADGSRYCPKHKCKMEDCLNKVQSRHLCAKHGGGKRCLDCTALAKYPGDKCVDHGGGVSCLKEGCSSYRDGVDGFCQAHGTRRPKCLMNGCLKAKQSNCQGMCKRHFVESSL